MSTLDRARAVMREELADAFVAADRERVAAAASWLRATGPLVEVYEVLLESARAQGPEYAVDPAGHVRRHRVQQGLRELVGRLGTTAHESSRGHVLVVVPGGSLHVLGVTALVHVLQDAGWDVVAAPELGLDDVEAELERLVDPAALCLGLSDVALLPRAREVVRAARNRWPALRVLVGGRAQLEVPDLATAVGAHATSSDLRTTLGALDDAASPLSPRELAVLACVARGMSNPDAAAHLGVAPATVKTHLDRVYAKLGTSDRTATVALALRKGWID